MMIMLLSLLDRRGGLQQILSAQLQLVFSYFRSWMNTLLLVIGMAYLLELWLHLGLGLHLEIQDIDIKNLQVMAATAGRRGVS